MKQSLKKIRLRQVQESIEPWTGLVHDQRPKGGWAKSVRQALGMSTTQLGGRLGLSRQAVADLERREVDKTVTLASLQKVAEAMNAELIYAIVPRESLETMIRRQARKKAEERLHRAAHTMGLEAQGGSQDEYNAQLQDAEQEVLREWPRDLWDTEGPSSNRG